MQVVDRYGCRTGTFYIIQQNNGTALSVASGPFGTVEIAEGQLDRHVRDGAKHLFIVEVKKHLQVATQVLEVVNG